MTKPVAFSKLGQALTSTEQEENSSTVQTLFATPSFRFGNLDQEHIKELCDYLSSKQIYLNKRLYAERDAVAAEMREVTRALFQAALKEKNEKEKDKEIDVLVKRQVLHSQFIEAKVPQNGGCFYDATFMYFIQKVFSGEITDQSETGKRIKEKLLPKIAARFQQHGLNMDFTDHNLRSAFLVILNAVQLSVINENQFNPPADNPEEAIQHCDFRHLFTDIVEPAFRDLFLEESRANRESTKALINEQLRESFIVYGIELSKPYAEQLGLDSDSILSAETSSKTGELHNVPESVKEYFLSDWKITLIPRLEDKAFQTACKNESQEGVKKEASSTFLNQSLNELFDTWRKETSLSDEAFNTYLTWHRSDSLGGDKKRTIMAGPVQQQVVANALHIDAVALGKKSDEFYPMTKPQQEPAAMRVEYKHTDLHYNALLKPELTYAAVLAERAECCDTPDLIAKQYPWDRIKSSPTPKPPAPPKPPAKPAADPIASAGSFFEKIEKVSKSIDKTQSQTEELVVDQLECSDLAKEILRAAQDGYAEALSKFGLKFANIKTEEGMMELTEETKAEAANLAFVIESQNEAIEEYLNNFRRK